MVRRAVEPIVPKQRNITLATHQDGRKLRRYPQRWIIERTNSWPQHFQQWVTLYEYYLKHCKALVTRPALHRVEEGSGMSSLLRHEITKD